MSWRSLKGRWLSVLRNLKVLNRFKDCWKYAISGSSLMETLQSHASFFPPMLSRPTSLGHIMVRKKLFFGQIAEKCGSYCASGGTSPEWCRQQFTPSPGATFPSQPTTSQKTAVAALRMLASSLFTGGSSTALLSPPAFPPTSHSQVWVEASFGGRGMLAHRGCTLIGPLWKVD